MGSRDEERDAHLYQALEDVRTSNSKDRLKHVKTLRSIFDGTERANLNALSDKAYHKIYEILFKLTLEEKANVIGAKKSTTTAALNRLTACADIVRLAIKAGAPKLKTKTVEAVVDHIVQTLPKANGDFFEPLIPYYLKSLCAVFAYKSNVERLLPNTWRDAVTFCFQSINSYLDENDGENSSLSRSFSSLGTGNGPSIKTGFGAGASYPQNRTGNISRQNADDLLLSLLYLVSTPNAPLLELVHEIVSTLMRFLGSHGSAVSSLHQSAFSALNAVLFFCREDRCALLQSLAQEVVPIISRLWQGKTSAKDEMFISVRDEMLILLMTVHLHLERSVLDEESTGLLLTLEDLLIVMKAEYARRSDRDRLQLDDLEMVDLGSRHSYHTPFHLQSFGLRSHNIKAERHWSNIQVIGILERLVSIGELKQKPNSAVLDVETDKHPRKRQRISQPTDRLIEPIILEDENIRLTGLQVLPFVLQNSTLPASVLAELLSQLSSCTSDKRGQIASWALLAIASCTHQQLASEEHSTDWVSLWHAAARALTFSATCRAASLALHAIIAAKLVQYRQIGEDIQAIITTPDTSGPVVLCDSAVFLMMHLLNVRVSEVPGASLVACNHVIRWLFAMWDPSDRSFATHLTAHVQPHYLVDLLRTTLGLTRVKQPAGQSKSGGPIAQAWEQHLSTQVVVRYLLLLDNVAPARSSPWCSSCPKHTRGNSVPYVLESAHFQQARKLILELLNPKLNDLLQTWRSHATDRGPAPSIETFCRAIYGCITILLLMPHFAGTHSSQLDSLEADLNSLIGEILKLLDEPETKDSREIQILVEALVQAVQPHLPSCGSRQFTQLDEKTPHLLQFFISIARLFEQRRGTRAAVDAAGEDLMDLDGFTPDQSQFRNEQQKNLIPRQDVALDMSLDSFKTVTRGRITLITAASNPSLPLGSVPSIFIDQMLHMPVEDLLLSRRLLFEILHSDLIIGETDASRLLEHLGTLMTVSEWSRCETMHSLCLNVLLGLGSLWFQPNGSDLADYGLQLYGWFIKVALDQNVASQNVLKGITRLLLLLMKLDTDTEPLSEIRSPRTSLFKMLETSSASVKFYIGNQLQEIFELFLLKDHDGIFVDILKSLPTNQDWIEGIALRLFVLAQLASHWTTLLRRCIYHIFEIPPRILDSARHATRCLIDVSSALKVEGPRVLFSLFAPQLLYTWLEFESIQEIPFQIFGFMSLKELVQNSQHVAAGLMVMRGQEEGVRILSELLEVSGLEVLQRCFTNIMAYSIAYSTSFAPTDKSRKHITGEMWVKKQLGNDLFFECINSHFSDILALLFNTIDQADVEKHLMKKEDLVYAGNILKEIKSISSSTVVLPPNQQPMFKARHLAVWISHLCGRTQYEAGSLYTPALVVSIARTLFNTIHSALGSLHACSVMRKIRLLVSLSGEVAVKGYPLEMLLRSVSAFITDTECADDCFGIIQYLLTRGSKYLVQSPSFFAGIALSILGSLGLLVQSPQSSTTQDSQYKATMSKAEKFRAWITKYVSEYESPALKNPSKAILPAIVRSADSIGTAGNAYTGTPESYLLFHLLEDEQNDDSLLSSPSREAALAMLCSNFKSPTSYREDIFGSDELSIANAAVVWKSCRGNSTNVQYLSWAGRVLGRAFSASGHVHQELLQESTLSQIGQLADTSEEDGSRGCVLSLLQLLTMDQTPRTVGLAEVALRIIVTTDDIFLADTCQRHLSKSLNEASMWSPYQVPVSEVKLAIDDIEDVSDPFTTDAILRPLWLRDFTVVLARLVPNDPVLRALVPILYGVPGFPTRAFPFILHLVISTPSHGQPLAKKRVSDAFTAWFKNSDAIDKNNLKMLINSVLYFRTQPLVDEKSSADRSRWLDIDYSKAATAAAHCGMFKTALLFVEEFCSGTAPARPSRRSSAINQHSPELPTELLLTIYHNIDDPDLYYGVQQTASLSSILARLEYEKDGPKSLAFRGAQYDSHIRRQDTKSSQDVESLVKALDVLNLSGLSHSLLQSQPTVGMSATLLESMFNTARKLEQWDIPVPDALTDNGITIYKAFQAVQKAADDTAVLHSINEAFESTMLSLVREDLSASALHSSLRTLAALVEIDEVLSTRGSVQFEELLGRFRARSNWMETGRFDDISQILSCRSTTLSILSEKPRLRKIIGLLPIDARLVEVQTILLSSQLSRSHNALQESLSLATSLMNLVVPCQALDLNLEAAIHLEAANALWDQGEMTSSIGMLQALNRNEFLKNQTIPIGRSDLLSKIGFQVSVARLENPDQILENYLKPALEELKGKSSGSEASHVFHQFATFCDQQLQDADGLEDLERLQKLTENKRDDVARLTKMLSSASTTAEKSRYRGPLSKNKAWLQLDEKELQRHTNTREEFLRQSLQNYLLALIASDEHDKNALRFTALWLEHSEEQMANEAVSEHLQTVPSRKFAPLMNQFTSRLQDTNAKFQQLLFELVLRICIDHPYHSMYQIYAGANYNINQKDDSATSRKKATSKVTKQISTRPVSNHIWSSISTTNKVYGQLAAEKDEQRYRSGKKIPLKESVAGARLSSMLSRYPIPSPTMQITLSADCDYSKVPVMVRFDPVMGIASGVSSPKIITAIANNGAQYKQLVKGGNDDLRQDAIMEQVFEQVSELLKTNRSTRQRDLRIRTYKVLPLTSIAGVIEFVADTIPLHEYLMPAHEKYYPKDLKGNQCRKEIGDVQSQPNAERIKRFRSVTDRFHPVMRYFFTEKFSDPDEWFLTRLAYTRSTAAISILGHVLGVGDRHGHNILLDTKSGEVVHIDLGVAFEMGRVLPVPELVPFRLTRDIVDGMGITKTEGVFRRCCEFTLEALRKEAYSIMTILDVLRYDPLYSWSISPVQLARLQEGQSAAAHEPGEGAILQKTKETNGPGEADRALTVVHKKLSKTLSVTATVNDLINQASDEEKLAVLYSGWAAYA